MEVLADFQLRLACKQAKKYWKFAEQKNWTVHISYNERSLRESLGCGAIWVERLKMMSRITQSFILSFMYLMVSWYLEVIDKLIDNIVSFLNHKKNVKTLGDKINVVVKTHPSFFDEFSRETLFFLNWWKYRRGLVFYKGNFKDNPSSFSNSKTQFSQTNMVLSFHLSSWSASWVA